MAGCKVAICDLYCCRAYDASDEMQTMCEEAEWEKEVEVAGRRKEIGACLLSGFCALDCLCFQVVQDQQPGCKLSSASRYNA